MPCTIAARHALFQLSGSWRCARLGRMATRRHIPTYAHASQCDTALTRVGRVEKRRCPQLPPIMPQSSSPTEKPSSCTQRHKTCSKRQRDPTGSTRPTHCRCTRTAAVRPAPRPMTSEHLVTSTRTGLTLQPLPLLRAGAAPPRGLRKPEQMGGCLRAICRRRRERPDCG